MKISTLCNLATAEGIDEDRIDEAMNNENAPKQAIIALLLTLVAGSTLPSTVVDSTAMLVDKTSAEDLRAAAINDDATKVRQALAKGAFFCPPPDDVVTPST